MHDELIAAIEDWRPALQGIVDRRTPLITSGHLDSLSLMRLLMWIEGKIGRPIQMGSVEMARDWDNVDSIVSFVERERDLR